MVHFQEHCGNAAHNRGSRHPACGVVAPLQMQAKKYDEGHRFRRWMRLVFLFFKFTVYIRVVLESYLLVCLSCVLEFWRLGSNYAIAVLAFVIVITVGFFVLWNYVERLQANSDDSNKKCIFTLYLSSSIFSMDFGVN
jgi:hypothetical protein